MYMKKVKQIIVEIIYYFLNIKHCLTIKKFFILHFIIHSNFYFLIISFCLFHWLISINFQSSYGNPLSRVAARADGPSGEYGSLFGIGETSAGLLLTIIETVTL